MKKLIFFIALGVSMILVSCKKDYVCTCTTSSNMPNYTKITETVDLGKLSPEDAASNCKAQAVGGTIQGYTFTEACTESLK